MQLADIVGDKALYALLLETTLRNLRIIAVMLQTDLFPPQLHFWLQLADIVGDKALYALLLETTFRNLRAIAVMLQTDLLCIIFPPQLLFWVQLADIVGDKALYALLLETTFRNLRILLLSERLKTETSERSLLKNLGSWLGKVGGPPPAHCLLLAQLNAESAPRSCEPWLVSGRASVPCSCRHRVFLHGKLWPFNRSVFSAVTIHSP